MTAFADYIGEDNNAVTDGQRGLSAVQSDRNKPQWIDKLLEINKDIAPLSVLLDKTGRVKEFGQAAYKHLEGDTHYLQVEVNGSQTSGDTTVELTTGHGARVSVGDILYNVNTEESLRVTAISTDDLTVTRGFGSSTAQAIDDNQQLLVLSQADTDGNTPPASKTIEPAIKTNYLQISKQTVELTGRACKQDNFGIADELAYQLKGASEALMIKRERTMLFGALNSSSPHATGGVDYWVTSNVTNAGGALDESTWNTFLKSFFRRNRGASNLIFYASENAMEAIHGFGRDLLRYDPKDKTLGIAVTNYQSPFGNIKIAEHGQLSSLVSDELAKKSYAFNLDLIKKAQWKGRGMHLMKDIETPGTDGKKHSFLVDWGLWLAKEKSHAILKGVTG